MRHYFWIEASLYERLAARVDGSPPCLRGEVGAVNRRRRVNAALESAIERALDAAGAPYPDDPQLS